jgi:hypothetical protein
LEGEEEGTDVCTNYRFARRKLRAEEMGITDMSKTKTRAASKEKVKSPSKRDRKDKSADVELTPE